MRRPSEWFSEPRAASRSAAIARPAQVRQGDDVLSGQVLPIEPVAHHGTGALNRHRALCCQAREQLADPLVGTFAEQPLDSPERGAGAGPEHSVSTTVAITAVTGRRIDDRTR